ncbi:unnamed protein product [Schistosoma haematobium]|nr:unnamed protein product [Schistosoma haematobium]
MRLLTLITVVLVISSECQKPVVAGPAMEIATHVFSWIGNIIKKISNKRGLDKDASKKRRVSIEKKL